MVSPVVDQLSAGTHTAAGPKVRKGLWRWAAVLAFPVSCPTTAHEFWLRPESYFLAPSKAATVVSLNVGEHFTGERVAFSRNLVAGFRHLSSGTEVDLHPLVPSDAATPDLAVLLAKEGTHVLALDTSPSHIVMSAEKFHAYLHEEGLDEVIRARASAGKEALPGRERYRRNVKALIRVGNLSDMAYARHTGQTIEIVPMADPSRVAIGTDIAFQVLFRGRPLPNAVVKFWHNRATQNLVVRTVTGDDGKVTITPPWPGVWMASVVHMIPTKNSSSDDWDSYWGNLTFALPDQAP